TEGQPVARQALIEEICAEVAALGPEEPTVVAALRRFKQREILRISYGDIIRGQSLDTVTRQISILADAIVEAAVRTARRQVESLEGALHYYDTAGRTWERQAFVKARTIAGDLDLGQALLAQLEPWVYRRYLSRADITGIKALKRRIEQRTRREGADYHNVKT